MKFVLCLLLATQSVYAAKSSNWVPKYQKDIKKTKKMDKQLLSKKVGQTPKFDKKAKSKKTIIPDNPLEAMYLKTPKNKKFLKKLKTATLRMKQQAVPTLTKVMKSNNYPSENRWVATYMLGRIMGVKAAPFVSRFAYHPNWMLRLASLKVLLHLGQKQYKGIYARLLEDKSLIVRHQALQNIKELKLNSLAPYVWKMLYNKANYMGGEGQRRRANIIKEAIKIVGDLKFKKAKPAMLTMMKKTKYKDVYEELDYSLSKITNKNSPKGSMAVKRNFWKKLAVAEVTI